MNIIIFEGNSPDLLAENQKYGSGLSAKGYADALLQCNSQISIHIAEPYDPSFDLESIELNLMDGAVFTGSGVDWSPDDELAKPQQQSMEAVFRHGLPTLGSCNGMQLAATVLGGKNAQSPNGRELGIAVEISLTEDGRNHPYHTGRPALFASPCIHRDEVSQLPHGAVITATNSHSTVQAMVYEQQGIRFWGTQYHPEYSTADLAQVLLRDGIFKKTDSAFIEDLTALEHHRCESTAARLRVSADDFLPRNRLTEIRNWLDSLSGSSPQT